MVEEEQEWECWFSPLLSCNSEAHGPCILPVLKASPAKDISGERQVTAIGNSSMGISTSSSLVTPACAEI